MHRLIGQPHRVQQQMIYDRKRLSLNSSLNLPSESAGGSLKLFPCNAGGGGGGGGGGGFLVDFDLPFFGGGWFGGGGGLELLRFFLLDFPFFLPLPGFVDVPFFGGGSFGGGGGGGGGGSFLNLLSLRLSSRASVTRSATKYNGVGKYLLSS